MDPKILDLTIKEYECLLPKCTIVHEGQDVIFYTPTVLAKLRATTLETKEPDTLEWIKGFNPDEILLDIGANVGMFTIWAAKTRGVQVYAFEPESQNFALLYRNIVLNDLGKNVIGYCAALSDEVKFALLHLKGFRGGTSGHSFGESVSEDLQPREAPYTQGCFSTTLDSLVSAKAIPLPTHIKIDVDGFEHKVIAGAKKTLKNPGVKSVLIEINPKIEAHPKIVLSLLSLGFTFSEEQVERCIRTEGPSTGVANYIFYR